jgi:hypothetical protein
MKHKKHKFSTLTDAGFKNGSWSKNPMKQEKTRAGSKFQKLGNFLRNLKIP